MESFLRQGQALDVAGQGDKGHSIPTLREHAVPEPIQGRVLSRAISIVPVSDSRSLKLCFATQTSK